MGEVWEYFKNDGVGWDEIKVSVHDNYVSFFRLCNKWDIFGIYIRRGSSFSKVPYEEDTYGRERA